MEEGIDFVRTEDGKHIILGTHYHALNGRKTLGATLLYIDSVWKLEESKKFQSTSIARLNAIGLCSDGGVILTGHKTISHNNFYEGIWVIKLDSNKTAKWSYMTSETPQTGIYRRVSPGAYISMESENDAIIVHHEFDSPDSTSIHTYNILISKISNKEVIWTQPIYHVPYFAQFPTDYYYNLVGINAVIRNSKTGFFMMVGYDILNYSSQIDDSHGFLVILRKDGTIYNYLYYDHWIFFHDIVEIDGIFIVIGTDSTKKYSTNSKIKVYGMNAYGSVLWNRGISNSFFRYSASTVTAIPNGFAIGGQKCHYRFYTGMTTCTNLIMGFDLNGNIMWESRFSSGNIKKMKYEEGKLVILEDLSLGVALATFTIPN
eukprot:TRINITY_DN4603_c0_g5_i1.p1 TRINITY_DN4603_c0_g5~~TRINITY_DN4603_c0_g5_i1.p1  ORF type:complete len:374 (-),score=9.09 TRINITY_DN4603_c0_g5_i1:170-1291(-)